MALMALLMAVFMLQVEALVIRFPLGGALTVYQSPASDSITVVAVSEVEDFSSLEVPTDKEFLRDEDLGFVLSILDVVHLYFLLIRFCLYLECLIFIREEYRFR